MVEMMNVNELKDKQVSRVKTGIKGLDDLIQGGFPKGSNIVLSGPPGSGKSIFGMAFLAEGCRNNEKNLYVTVEQAPMEIIEQAYQFNWDFNQWINQGLLNIYHIDFKKPFEMGMFEELLKNIENNQYNRMVIDSINPLSFKPLPVYYVDHRPFMPERIVVSEITRANIIGLFDKTRSKGITTVCISQKDYNDASNTVIDYIGDGLITLDSIEVGTELSRTLKVKKLRKTDIDGVTHIFKFSPDGISIAKREI